MNMTPDLDNLVLKSLAVVFALVIGLSFASIAYGQMPAPGCPSCLDTSDPVKLELYKEELPIVIWASSLDPGDTTIELKGQSNIQRGSIPVVITVFNPINNIVTVDQVMPNQDGSFSSDIRTGGPLWKQDGIYVIKAQQGDESSHRVKIAVDIVNGAVVPEFGTVAISVLLISIIAIIALSSKSRLSLFQNFNH